MSQRYFGGILSDTYNSLKVPNAPTIGTLTAPTSTTLNVAFTAPACVGASNVIGYQVFVTPGCKIATNTSSPVVVGCLTAGTTYTAKVTANNTYGYGPFSSTSSFTIPVIGSQSYTTPGTYSWVAPTSVTKVSVVAVGGGSNCGGAGGLGWKNNITVVPGNSYTVVAGGAGTTSYFCTSSVVSGGGGSGKTGGGHTGCGGGNGGNGAPDSVGHGGGGGAGGYSGNGGSGATNPATCGHGRPGDACSGAAGAGTSPSGFSYPANGGGGVGILGKGTTGACSYGAGNPGSGGTAGQSQSGSAAGGVYGGGGSGGGAGGVGAIRIVWPGCSRLFPSTSVGSP